MSRLLIIPALALALSCVQAEPSRVVSVGGAVTETIYALGADNVLVGVDTSSIYPEAATKLPQVGYQRALSAEGIVSLKPDLLILGGASGPPPVLEQIKSMSIPLVMLDDEHTIQAAEARIREIGKVLNKTEEAEKLVRNIEEALAKLPANAEKKPRVVFLFARGPGSPILAGKGTAADAMIQLAGGENAGSDFEGYKPVSAEALAAMAPDVILTTTRTQAQLGGENFLDSVPGMNLTPAGQNKRVIVMEDLYLLGFGPRVGEAVVELADKLQNAAH